MTHAGIMEVTESFSSFLLLVKKSSGENLLQVIQNQFIFKAIIRNI